MLDLAGFRTMFPEITATAYPDAQVNQALADALLYHYTTPRLIGLCAAHLLTRTGGYTPIEKSAQGSVTIEREYSGERPTNKFWLNTKYGMLLVQLVRANTSIAYAVADD
ncbi:MAG: DUF4054 domain-containing protein [Rhodothermaceae bacterium]|nr:DUF4054 domain-containing protein [Rhodothermaceae bacterium]MYF79847.1 DUF4054 domain-containing protein [Chloroflexota bacterium]